jgi:hypothetical protein
VEIQNWIKEKRGGAILGATTEKEQEKISEIGD